MPHHSSTFSQLNIFSSIIVDAQRVLNLFGYPQSTNSFVLISGYNTCKGIKSFSVKLHYKNIYVCPFCFRFWNENASICNNQPKSLVSGLDVHLHFVLPIWIALFCDAWWPHEGRFFSNEQTVVVIIYHQNLFLQTLSGAQA